MVQMVYSNPRNADFDSVKQYKTYIAQFIEADIHYLREWWWFRVANLLLNAHKQYKAAYALYT